MWLTIVLSFGFYIPVVLWADAVPMIGMLMIPQDLRLCVDGADRLLCNETGTERKGKLTMKRYIHTALLYAVLAMAGGVFYREFTRFTGYTGKTALSVVHTHYFLLGMVFFLLLLLLEKSFRFTTTRPGRCWPSTTRG